MNNYRCICVYITKTTLKLNIQNWSSDADGFAVFICSLSNVPTIIIASSFSRRSSDLIYHRNAQIFFSRIVDSLLYRRFLLIKMLLHNYNLVQYYFKIIYLIQIFGIFSDSTRFKVVALIPDSVELMKGRVIRVLAIHVKLNSLN